jgi:transposase
MAFQLPPHVARMNGRWRLAARTTFAGSDGGAARWAIVASLLATAKLNDVEPFTYLKDILERLSNGYPMARLDDLLPGNWTSIVAAAA